MPEEKSKRIAIGATIGGVLLVIMLVVIIVVQFVQMGVRRRMLNENRALIEKLQQENERNEHDLERFDDDLKYLYALYMGYLPPNSNG